MALVLAMLAASLAWGEEVGPEVGPEPAPALALEPPPLSIDHYRSGTHLATTGLVLVPVGFGLGVSGFVLLYTAQTQGQALIGVGAVFAGGAATLVGPPLTIIGSLKSARALRRAGIPVPTGWAVASTVLYVGALVFPPAYLGAVATGALQMAANTSALRHAGERPRGSATILPWKVDDAHGLALVGSF